MFWASSNAPPLIVLLNSVRPTSAPFTIGLFRYFTPTKPEPGKNGGPKIAGSKVHPSAPAEVVRVHVAQRERHVDRRVVHAGLGHVHVGREGGEEVGDGVAAVRNGDAERGLVPLLEQRALAGGDVAHAGPDASA